MNREELEAKISAHLDALHAALAEGREHGWSSTIEGVNGRVTVSLSRNENFGITRDFAKPPQLQPK